MKPIDLDELPRYSAWPEVLISDCPPTKVRTPKEVAREYAEKYGPILERAREGEIFLAEDARRAEQAISYESPIAYVTAGDRLRAGSTSEAREYVEMVMEAEVTAVALMAGARSVVDLGCGYGWFLGRLRARLPRVDLRGGDVSPEAVELAGLLYDDDQLRVWQLDLVEHLNHAPLVGATSPIVVTTTYAFHQLPTHQVKNALRRLREIANLKGFSNLVFVTLEPDDASFPAESLLGQLRRRYQEVNGYSGNLLRVVGEMGGEIVRRRGNCAGTNALLPGTLAVWRFR